VENILEMAYHPAKKEIKFQRFQNGKSVEIKEGSKLTPYMDQKGKFVLQHNGEEFFEAISGNLAVIRTSKCE